MARPPTDLGRILRRRREALGLTIREVQRRCGISNSYLSQVENGKIEHPGPLYLAKIAEIYQIPVGDIYYHIGYVPPAPPMPAANCHYQLFHDLSASEETALVQYLTFLRWRSR